MKDLVFLPDREGRDELTAATGFVRCGADASALGVLASRLTVRKGAAEEAGDSARWRGTLALALLADAWPDEDAKLSVMTVDASTSRFASWLLKARGADEPVRLVLLEKDGKRVLLGIADAAAGLLLPATPSDLSEMMPARCTWFDRENGGLTDPVRRLDERARALLLRRIHLMGLTAPAVQALVSDLGQAEMQEAQPVRQGDAEALAALSIRMQAVCGLSDFAAFSEETAAYEIAGRNPLVACFADEDAGGDDGLEVSRTYCWNGIAFARTSSFTGLTTAHDSREQAALDDMAAELAMMAENSVSWNRRLGQRLQAWLDERRSSRTLLSAAKEHIELTQQLAAEKGRQLQTTVTLEWPWNAESGAVRALLEEALGGEWLAAAAAPFADRLTKLSGFVLGDRTLQTCCACADGILLPPLSEKMAACAAKSGDGEGLALDAMRFQPREDGGITASFLLRGKGEVRMQRVYALDEILVLSEYESPRAAVWPCLPMESWHAYHVFLQQGGTQVLALRDGEWAQVESTGSGWACLRTESYPACLLIRKDDLTLGAVPNMLPLCRVTPLSDAAASIDMGASATVSVLSINGTTTQVNGRELTRLLLMPENAEPDEFLMSLRPDSVTPTAVELTGEGGELFTDGYVYRSAGFAALAERAPDRLKTALKWRADAASVRARRILMHQVMLGTALEAALEGAKTLCWRVTVADEMGGAGREALLEMMEDLARTVAAETGLPLPAGQPAVAWTAEAHALCAYLRGNGTVRGSFTVLDIGAVSTKTHLWLQGQSRPAAGAVVLDGAQSTLFAALKERPDMLLEDFGDVSDPALQADVQTLCIQLHLAAESRAQTDKALLMLDKLLDEHKQKILAHMADRTAAQHPTHMQAILLEMQAAALFTAGLMLEQAGMDTMLNHRLPDDMPLCLTGRGTWLTDSLPTAMRNSLQKIVRAAMSLGNTIRFVTITPDRLPAAAVALGMAAVKETGDAPAPAPIHTRASFSALMCSMMKAIIAAYPAHAWLLHPGLFDMWGELTPAGEDTVRAAASRCYGDGDDIPGAVMAFVHALRQSPIAPQLFVSPGE